MRAWFSSHPNSMVYSSQVYQQCIWNASDNCHEPFRVLLNHFYRAASLSLLLPTQTFFQTTLRRAVLQRLWEQVSPCLSSILSELLSSMKGSSTTCTPIINLSITLWLPLSADLVHFQQFWCPRPPSPIHYTLYHLPHTSDYLESSAMLFQFFSALGIEWNPQ